MADQFVEVEQIRGLPDGKYALRIEEEKIGIFDAAGLAEGLNLATLVTPMSRQAQAVLGSHPPP